MSNSESTSTWWDAFLNDPPTYLPIFDEYLCQNLLENNLQMIDNLTEYLIKEEKIDQFEIGYKPISSRFEYPEGDSYDWHIALGCLQCGAAYEVDLPQSGRVVPNVLVCTTCGNSICLRPTMGESDSLQNNVSPSSTQPSNEMYLYGNRQRYIFGQMEKDWWQDRFVSAAFQQEKLDRQLQIVKALSQKNGSTCHEECQACGHTTAFYHCFQARSADEGMTIMFECCQCGTRKVVNT